MSYAVLSGVIFALCLVAATLFLRSFGRTRDRLFALFAASFCIFAVNQLVLGLLNRPEADLPLAHLPRLISSLLIIVAIADKNRSAAKAGPTLRLVHDRRPQADSSPASRAR